jgi:hypothetical protein
MKQIIGLFFCLFLLKTTCFAQKQDYFVISVGEDAIYYNGKAIKEKDKIPTNAKLYFSSHIARAIVYSPKDGKMILSIEKTNEKGEKLGLMQSIETTLTPPLEYYLKASTRGEESEVSLEDFATILQDNPVESDLITVYFIDNKPFVIPIPKVLTENDAYFALKNKTHFFKLPVKEGRLRLDLKIPDGEGQIIDILQVTQLQFYYYTSPNATPYLLGKIKFEAF